MALEDIAAGSIRGNNGKKITEPSDDKAYVVGSILGDGHLSDTNGTITFTTSNIDLVSEYSERVCRFIGVCWDGIDSDETNLSITKKDKGDGLKDMYDIRKGQSQVYRLMKKICEDWSSEEVVSHFDNGDNLKYLIRGLWDSEGSVKGYRNRTISFCNTDRRIIRIYVNSMYEYMSMNLGSIKIVEENDDRYSTGEIIRVKLDKMYYNNFRDKINPVRMR